jgi:hypothetical protein
MRGSKANWSWLGVAPSRPSMLYLLFWFAGSILIAFLVIPLVALTASQSWTATT